MFSMETVTVDLLKGIVSPHRPGFIHFLSLLWLQQPWYQDSADELTSVAREVKI